MVRKSAWIVLSAALLLPAGCAEEEKKPDAGGGQPAGTAQGQTGGSGQPVAGHGASGQRGGAGRTESGGAGQAAGPASPAATMLSQYIPENAFVVGVMQPPRILDSPIVQLFPQQAWEEMEQETGLKPSAFELLAVVAWPAGEGEPSIFDMVQIGGGMSAPPPDFAEPQFETSDFGPGAAKESAIDEAVIPADEGAAKDAPTDCGPGDEDGAGADVFEQPQFAGQPGGGPRPNVQPPAVSGCMIMRLATAADAQKFGASAIPKSAEAKEFNGKSYRANQRGAVYAADDRTFVFSTEPGIKALLSSEGGKGPLVEQLNKAGLDHDAVLVVRISDEVRKELQPALQQAPPQTAAIVNGMQSASLALDVDADARLSLRVEADKPQTAQQIQQVIDGGLGLAGFMLPSAREDMARDLGEEEADKFIALLTDVLQSKESKVDGSAYSLSMTVPEELQDTIKVLVARLEKRQKEARRRMNLQMIGIAMHNYHDAHNALPAPAIVGEDGKPLLSWRVAILPFTENFPLHEQFHLDEAWDSEHNKALLEPIPQVYTMPEQDTGTKTVLLMPIGEGTLFSMTETVDGRVFGPQLFKISDGTSNTIMLIEVDAQHAVEWSKPQDWQVNMDQPLEGLPESFNVLFADGSTDTFTRDPKTGMLKGSYGTYDAAAFKAMLTAAGAEPVSRFGGATGDIAPGAAAPGEFGSSSAETVTEPAPDAVDPETVPGESPQ